LTKEKTMDRELKQLLEEIIGKLNSIEELLKDINEKT